MTIKKKLILSFLGLFIVSVTLAFVSIGQLKKHGESFKNQLLSRVGQLVRAAYIDEIANDINYYDETLTQSARNYAFTQDKRWKERYLDHDKKLNELIDKIQREGNANDKLAFKQINQANRALISMELQAIEDTDQGQAEKAVALLESEAYWDQKDIYRDGLVAFVGNKNLDHNKAIVSSNKMINDLLIGMTARLSSSNKNIILLFFASGTFAATMSFYMYSNISKSLSKLQHSAQLISSGDFDTLVDISGHDEIAKLAQSLAQMRRSLKKNVISISQLQKEVEVRKRLAEEMRQSELRFQLIFENSPDAIFWADAKTGIFLNCNKAAEKLVERPRDEILGQHFKINHPPEILEFIKQDYQNHVAGKSQYAEIPLITKSNKRKLVSISSTTAVIGENQIIQGVFRDITELKLTEERLKESESRYRTLYDDSADAIMILHPGKGFISGNTACIRLFECENEAEFISHSPASLSPELQRDGMASDVKADEMIKIAIAKESHSFEWTHRTARGRLFDASVLLTRIQLNQQTALQATVRDITQAKQHQIQLEKLVRAVEQSPVSIVITNTAGVTEYVNPFFSARTGYSRDEAIGKNPRILKSGLQKPDFYKNMWETITSGKEWHGEFVNRAKNGELFWENATISALKNEKGEVINYIAVKEDITERKRSEEKLKLMQSELIQAEKLDSIGRLASGVAHEVKNPLAILLQGADYLAQNVKAGDENIKFVIESMKNAVKRADSVIRGLLDFSSLSTMNIVSVRFHELIDTSLLLTKHEFEKNHIHLIKKFSSEVFELKIDRNRIEQVLVNLILNAIHAMPNGGELEIKTYRKKIDKNYNALHEQALSRLARGDGELVGIDIEDTGTGIPEDILGKIFDPFFTTKRESGGTGLGLSVVRSIMDQHNGIVKIQNRETRGARATLLFPT